MRILSDSDKAVDHADDIVAKLLADENITVVYANGPSASFDVSSRTMSLPNWKVDKIVRLLLRGHEAAHALFTPAEGLHDSLVARNDVDPRVFKQYLNVIEDTRIERLMSRKFRGLHRIFVLGHQQLFQRGFYGPDLTKAREMIRSGQLIDRILAYYRLGPESGVQFGQDEMVYVLRAGATETFPEVAQLAFDLYQLALARQPPKSESVAAPPDLTDEHSLESVPEEPSESTDEEPALDPADEGVSDDSSETATSESDQKQSEQIQAVAAPEEIESALEKAFRNEINHLPRDEVNSVQRVLIDVRRLDWYNHHKTKRPSLLDVEF